MNLRIFNPTSIWPGNVLWTGAERLSMMSESLRSLSVGWQKRRRVNQRPLIRWSVSATVCLSWCHFCCHSADNTLSVYSCISRDLRIRSIVIHLVLPNCCSMEFHLLSITSLFEISRIKTIFWPLSGGFLLPPHFIVVHSNHRSVHHNGSPRSCRHGIILPTIHSVQPMLDRWLYRHTPPGWWRRLVSKSKSIPRDLKLILQSPYGQVSIRANCEFSIRRCWAFYFSSKEQPTREQEEEETETWARRQWRWTG